MDNRGTFTATATKIVAMAAATSTSFTTTAVPTATSISSVTTTSAETAVTIRRFERKDQETALRLFKVGLFQYAVKGSVVAHMEAAYYASASKGDMRDIYSHYIEPEDKNFWVAEMNGNNMCA